MVANTPAYLDLNTAKLEVTVVVEDSAEEKVVEEREGVVRGVVDLAAEEAMDLEEEAMDSEEAEKAMGVVDSAEEAMDSEEVAMDSEEVEKATEEVDSAVAMDLEEDTTSRHIRTQYR